MKRGKYNKHDRMFRICPKCGDKKSVDMFRIHHQTINGREYTRYLGNCNDCKNVVSINTIRRPKNTLQNVKKFCHNCMKWKDINTFRLYKMTGDKGVPKTPSNYCPACEKEIGESNQGHFFRNEPSRVRAATGGHGKDLDEFNYAFIGNKPYKEICKIFKINFQEN